MKELGGRLVIGLLIALLGLCGVLYVQTLRAELKTAQEAQKAAQQGISDRDADIEELKETSHRVALGQARMEGERTAVRSILAEREIVMRNLQNENAEVRAWAATGVPGDIARLHDHPAITGAKDYRERMRPGDPVRPAGGVASPER